jgi:hypothetical protein
MNDKLVLSLVAVVVGCWLASNPRCSHGCKTVAEHLVSGGIDNVLNGLFA